MAGTITAAIAWLFGPQSSRLTLITPTVAVGTVPAERTQGD